ncbi:MAG: methyltransferase [Alphaproteobacteria bacterium]|nr:methyltransferase [Alphaproteobacteria bacterium]
MTQSAIAQNANAPVDAVLTFIKRQDTKPYFNSSAITGGAPEIFFETENRNVSIEDFRPLAAKASMDVEGFELLRSPTAVADLYDDEAIDTAYAVEIKALLTERFGATAVHIFDVTRRSDGDVGAANPDGLRGPANRVHVDYTPKSGPQRTRDVLGDDEAERLFKSGAHIVQVNVWRPISGPVKRSPLALADASSVNADELIATDQIFPDRVGEIYNVAHADTQRWYYAPEMERDEVFLIKGWDSIDDGRAKFTPHGAFALQNSQDAPPRESIEVRTLVVIE